MRFIHEGTKYEFDETRLTFAEARAMEKVTGRTMGDFQRTGGDDATSMQAMMWVAMRRTNPDLRFSELDDVAMNDFEMLPADEEQPPADPTGPVADREGSPSSG